jgi:hypothetical protein
LGAFALLLFYGPLVLRRKLFISLGEVRIGTFLDNFTRESLVFIPAFHSFFYDCTINKQDILNGQEFNGEILMGENLFLSLRDGHFLNLSSIRYRLFFIINQEESIVAII